MCDIAELSLSDLRLLNSNFLQTGIVSLERRKGAHKTRKVNVIYKSEKGSESYEICKVPPQAYKRNKNCWGRETLNSRSYFKK